MQAIVFLLTALLAWGQNGPEDGAATEPSAALPAGPGVGYLFLYPSGTRLDGVTFESEFWTPDGEKSRLVVSSGAPGSAASGSLTLPFSADQVVWAGLLPSLVAHRLDQGVILEGDFEAGRREPSRVANVSPLAEDSATIAQDPPASGPTQHNQRRSGWIWKPSAWRDHPQALLAKLDAWEMKRVFITVPASRAAVESPSELAAFIEAAKGRGIDVWAVDGDRFALLDDQRHAFLARAQAYADYNAGVPEGHRLTGLQYDIEPYLMPGYSLHSAEWNQKYVELLGIVKKSTGLPLEIALPFWFDRQACLDGPFLDLVAPLIDSLVVMDYRTDSAEILRFAQPFLRWGERHGRPVHIAVETVALPDTRLAIYRPASKGSLWLWSENGLDVLVLLKTPLPGKGKGKGKGQLFSFSHSTNAPASRTTFHGQEAVLLQRLPELERALANWPSFAGLAVHGIE